MALLAAGLVVALTLGVTWGSVSIGIGEVWSTVSRHLVRASTTPGGHDSIIWRIRAPRVLLGALVGAGLGVIGVAVQAMVRNPLADPYVMGVESGAAVGAVAVIFLGRAAAYHGIVTPAIGAFVGATATLVAVFGLARSRGRVAPVRLLLVGVALSYALSGVTSFFLYASRDPGAQRAILFWILGGLGGATWGELPLAAAVVGVGVAVVWYAARPLNALSVGDASATALGVDPDRLRIRLLLVCSLVVAVLVSMVGPIGFVGLVIPHVGRMLFGADHRRLVPASVLLGAIYLVLVDLVCRTLFAPSEIPIGVVTAMLGTPFFLWLIRRRQGAALGEAW